jgi:hypothetical protein
MLEQHNGSFDSFPNEHVAPHVDIDEGEILNFTYYNSLPHPSFQVEKISGVVFLINFLVAIPSLIVVLKLLPHLPSPCERVSWAFFGVKI